MSRALFILLFAANSYGQYDSAFSVTLANKIKVLQAIRDSCKSYIAKDSSYHKEVQNSIAEKDRIIALQGSQINDCNKINTLHKSKEEDYKKVIDSYKPSWLEQYLLRREVLLIIGLIGGYLIGR